MKIDMYAHILPLKYMEALGNRLTDDIKKRHGMSVTLWDLKQRFHIMDKYQDYKQVLTHSVPIEALADPDDAVHLVKIGNDEMAEIVIRHPDRFVAGVATLPMHNIDAALKEAERSIKELGLKGVLVYSNINGKPLDTPAFIPLYAMMARYDLPIWIHPRRDHTVADYSTESESKYRLHGVLGWPYETQLAMCRLALSGTLEKYPNLKIITHHCGAGIPFIEHRIANWLRAYSTPKSNTDSGKLTKPPVEYLRMFYGDTAINGNVAALMCGYAFFGVEHLIFGTDTPFGGEDGDYFIRETVQSVMEMSITDMERNKIFEENAKNLLHLIN